MMAAVVITTLAVSLWYLASNCSGIWNNERGSEASTASMLAAGWTMEAQTYYLMEKHSKLKRTCILRATVFGVR